MDNQADRPVHRSKEWYQSLGRKSAEKRKGFPKEYYAELGRRSVAIRKAKKEAKRRTPLRVISKFLSTGQI